MNTALLLSASLEAARPDLLACALAAARIAPMTFLCPVFGGQLAPTPVRLALTLGLATHIHFAGGIEPAIAADASALVVLGAFARELLCGVVIGLVASLPFDAARMGGRILDTVRGANAEAALPVTGSREAATGDMLHQLLCALVCASSVLPVLARTLALSFRVAPLGTTESASSAGYVTAVVGQATTALGTGLAIGAPAAAIALVIDLALGLAARVSPSIPAREIAAPAKLVLGAVATLFAIGAIAQRLLAEVASGADTALRAAAMFGSAP